jgi:hypothetical protein
MLLHSPVATQDATSRTSIPHLGKMQKHRSAMPNCKIRRIRALLSDDVHSKDYISRIKHGVKSNRFGKVISIEHEGNAASAKNEVDMPGRKRTYTDHLLVLKEIGV